MPENQSRESTERKPYVRPVVERVVLDPIKEMLLACPEAQGGKTGATCTNNFS